MLIKICGLTRPIDIDYVNELKPDYIGFIFALNKRRTITIDKAKELKKKLDKNIKVVGVFLNNDINYIKQIVDEGIIDLIQLHGNEDDNYIKEIKLFTNLEIIKAYRISKYANYVLYDNVEPGLGIKICYDNLNKEKPFFLAGGIDISNIDEAIKENPYCIDISSGVESNGFKDYEKIKEVIRRCKNGI